jgi:hypothetical protein
MARTILTPQRLDTKAGEQPTYQTVDPTNGMQTRNSGVEVVAVRTVGGTGLTVQFPSVACSHGRLGDVSTVQAQDVTQYYGPFTDPATWGDGGSQLFIDASTFTGTAQIAVIVI